LGSLEEHLGKAKPSMVASTILVTPFKSQAKILSTDKAKLFW
jgi:hypothetical protein